MTINRFLLGLSFWIIPAVYLTAQNVEFINYQEKIDSAKFRALEFLKKHPNDTINLVRRHILTEFGLQKKFRATLPEPYTRTLTGPQLDELSKKGTFVYFALTKNPTTKEYQTVFWATAIALTEDGTCVTNYHVLSNVILSGALQYYPSDEVMYFIMSEKGKVYPVNAVLTADPFNDFAIFTVDTGGDKLTPIPLGQTPQSGSEVYCLSNPQENLYYLSKGIVARNVEEVDPNTGRSRLCTQITADYAKGSSGGPILDTKGNLVGMVSTTTSIYAAPQMQRNFQMAVKSTVPVQLIKARFISSSQTTR